jgi:hypothetical protein
MQRVDPFSPLTSSGIEFRGESCIESKKIQSGLPKIKIYGVVPKSEIASLLSALPSGFVMLPSFNSQRMKVTSHQSPANPRRKESSKENKEEFLVSPGGVQSDYGTARTSFNAAYHNS